jgi:hypothetical protein
MSEYSIQTERIKLDLPAGDGFRGPILASKVEEVDSVGSSIALGGGTSGVTDGQMVIRDSELLLDFKRSLDESGEQPRGDVPLNVAVEEPDT